MAAILIGVFKDSQAAGDAVSELKQKGYTKEISVLAYDEKYADPRLHEVKKDISTGTSVGATVGAVTGVLAGVFSGLTTVLVPGIGLIVGGPLAALLGLTGGAVGGLAGGLLGALLDLGINEPTAKVYEQRIRKGEVLVGVSTEPSTREEVETILNRYGVEEITTVHKHG